MESVGGREALASVEALVQAMLRGETPALARLITLVEREGPEVHLGLMQEALDQLPQ